MRGTTRNIKIANNRHFITIMKIVYKYKSYIHDLRSINIFKLILCIWRIPAAHEFIYEPVCHFGICEADLLSFAFAEHPKSTAAFPKCPKRGHYKLCSK